VSEPSNTGLGGWRTPRDPETTEVEGVPTTSPEPTVRTEIGFAVAGSLRPAEPEPIPDDSVAPAEDADLELSAEDAGPADGGSVADDQSSAELASVEPEPLADDPVLPEEGAAVLAPAADAGEDAGEGADSAEALPELDDVEFEAAIEALLLVVDTPVEEEVMATALGSSVGRVTETLRAYADRLAERQSGIDLRRIGGGWRFYTRDRYAPYVERMLLDGQRAKLTRAALETLAVIAYRQPVTRARVAAVRGVNCDGVIRTLLARGLVEETGTDLETGGYLYRTTELFLERLGLSSLDELPPIAPLLPEVDTIDDL